MFFIYNYVRVEDYLVFPRYDHYISKFSCLIQANFCLYWNSEDSNHLWCSSLKKGEIAGVFAKHTS